VRDRPSASQRFEVLDGWRGIAALWISLFHLNIASGFLGLSLVRDSYILVDFFFVLSGFVISHTYLQRLRTTSDLRDFSVRRFSRVWPLHAFMLLAFAAVEMLKLPLWAYGASPAPLAVPFDAPSLVANLLLFTSMGLTDHTTWNFPSWSISAEFWTYLAFAMCVLGARRLGGGVYILFALCLGFGAAVVISGSAHGMDASYDLGLYRCFYGFFLGTFVYRLWQLTGRGGQRLGWAEIPAVIALVCFVGIIGTSWLGFLAPLVSALVVFIFAFEAGPVSRFMRNRAIAWLGQHSYTIYMVHAFVAMNLVFRPVQIAERVFHLNLTTETAAGDRLISLHSEWLAAALTIGYLSAVLLLSGVLYRRVELPGQKLFLRLMTRPRARTAAPMHAA